MLLNIAIILWLLLSAGIIIYFGLVKPEYLQQLRGRRKSITIFDEYWRQLTLTPYGLIGIRVIAAFFLYVLVEFAFEFFHTIR